MKSMLLKKTLSVILLVAMLVNAMAVVPFAAFADTLGFSSGSDMTQKQESSSSASSDEHAYEPFKAIKEYQYSNDADQIDETSLLLKISADAPAMSPVPEAMAKLGVTMVRTVVDVTTPEAMEQVGAKTPYRWVVVALENAKATEIALSFAEIPYILDAEYNHIRQTTAMPDATTNPSMIHQWYLDDTVKNSWQHLDDNGWRENLENVVVAVIDTGVDYEHHNLRDSMWVNTGEIPGNGMDDDSNGYVDDVYGISTVGETWAATGDPMDNMGHGTHVAGIIAAAPDQMGMVGLAYGVQIMAIRAGDGFFNDSDIVEGINYAVEMGADVINMSFGSYTRSTMMEEALAIAYSSAVLVAAAGNDSTDTANSACYPAAYDFVIGVMAEDETGKIAGFSNTDSIRRNSVEYEVSAPGSRIFSTLPDDRYASWSGTSMAAPYVSAVAALLRAKFNDKANYSTRFLMGQIVGTVNDTTMGRWGTVSTSVDAYRALTEVPEPDLSYYDFYIFDDKSYSDKNNGDGIIDAGETIGLGIVLRNHWGEAKQTTVTLTAAMSATDPTPSPYVTWETDTILYGDIGTFMTASNGFTYNADGVITGITSPFMFTVDEKTPNDASLTFALSITCETYVGEEEPVVYHFDDDTFTALVRQGVELPRRIMQDMVLKSDTYYIIAGSTLIDQGVTVTVEPGTQIQFWGDYSKELYAGTDIAQLIVQGEFIVEGTEDNPVDIFPSGSMHGAVINIAERNQGRVQLKYCNVANPKINVTSIDHCYFAQLVSDYMYTMSHNSDDTWYNQIEAPSVQADSISNSIFFEMGYFTYNNYYGEYHLSIQAGTLTGNLFDSCALRFQDSSVNIYKDNVFLKNTRLVSAQNGETTYLNSEFYIQKQFQRTNCLYPLLPVKNPETGSTYFVLSTPSLVLAEDFARSLGGHVVRLDDENERDFVLEYIERYYVDNEEVTNTTGQSLYNFYVGFYRNDAGLQYIGASDGEGWLSFDKNTSIPVIYTSYWTTAEGEIIREAYITTTIVWSSEYSYLSSKNPSESRWSSSGVIIEVPGDISPVSVTLDVDALTLPSNTVDYLLGSSLFPKVDNAELLWSSDNESVVTVDENGKITAQGVGVAKITVTIAGTNITDEAIISIVEYYEPAELTDEESSVTLNKYQQTHQLTPTVLPAEATPILDYTSSDTSVVVVSTTGLITAVSNGTATITVSVRGTALSMTYTVVVAIPPSSITMKPDYLILALDDTTKTTLSYTYAPAFATVNDPLYVSSDPSVVTVDEKGVLTPVSSGNAVVTAYFADVDMSVKTRIYVAASRSEVNIVDAQRISSNHTGTILYAEDGTAYLLRYDSSYADTKFPTTLPVKMKQASTRWYNSSWAYIDTNDTLYYSGDSSFSTSVKVAEKVADVEFYHNSDHFYYLMQDGTVWFYNVYTHTSTNNGYLSDIVAMTATDNRYLFLDSTGTLWHANIPSPSSQDIVSFDVQIVPVEETVKDFSAYYCYTEEGHAYRITWDGDTPTLREHSNLSAEMLDTTLGVSWDDVVDIRSDYGAERFWLLLNDGRVVFSGYYGNYSEFDKNISEIISCPANGSWGYSFVDLPQKVIAMGGNAFVLADGSVLTLMVEWSSALGNGKAPELNRNLTYPVSPWIGTYNDKQAIACTHLTISTSNGDVSMPVTSEHLNVKVSVNAKLTLSLSKFVENNRLANLKLYFKDSMGEKISATAKLDAMGQALIITADKPLREGYDYSLTIDPCLYDIYGNGNNTLQLSFTAEGTAVYEVPVVGLEGNNEDVLLAHNETKQLYVTVLPDNATMKTVYWSTSDADVATVGPTGLVTGRGNGVATIRATTADGNFQKEFKVTVSTPPSKVTVQSEFIYMEKNETGRYVTLIVTPSYADMGVLTYASMDPSIAAIDGTGCITALAVGKTTVSVTSSQTGETYFVAVQVVEDSASGSIIRGIHCGYNYSQSYFIAEDHTLWLISPGNNYFGNQNSYIPQNTGVKAIDAQMIDGYLFYVTENGQLYRKYTYNNEDAQLLGSGVTAIVPYNWTGRGLFCLMSDGNVSFWHENQSELLPCHGLSNVKGMNLVGGHYIFIKTDGTVKYCKESSNYTGFTDVQGNYIDITFPEKIIDFVWGTNEVLGESKEHYSFYYENDKLRPSSRGLTSRLDYRTMADHIVKMVYTNMNYGDAQAYLALLDDGRVAYVGYNSYIPSGLSSVLSANAYSDGFVIEFLPGIHSVADIIPGYFILANGSVLAFALDNNNSCTSLGNNNKDGKTYNAPVTAWFGAMDDKTTISIQSVQAFTAGGMVEATAGRQFTADLKADTTFVLTLSDIAFYRNFSIVYLQDELGNRVAVTCTVDTTGKILTLKPTEALQAGYEYELVIPAQTFGNNFRYYNTLCRYSLKVEGAPVYSTPVESLEAVGNTEHTLQYGESVQLAVTVGPINATQKKVSWASSNERVATVSTNGLVTAHYNGTAQITATTKDGAKVVTFTITVSTTPMNVQLLDELVIMEKGESGRTIRLEASPSYADLGTLTYESLDPTVVTVNENGVITAVAAGITRVGVTSSKTGVTYYAEVQVKEDTASLHMNALQTSRSNLAIFTAEDGTVWYLTANTSLYLPQKASFKANKVFGGYDYYNAIYYINENSSLCKRYSIYDTYEMLIADQVVTAAFSGSHVFYLTKTKDVYYHGDYGDYRFTSMHNITDIVYLDSGVFVFTDAKGQISYLYTGELNSKNADTIIKELDCDEKVVSILPRSSTIVTESGTLYQFSSYNYTTRTYLADLESYQAIRQNVVALFDIGYTSSYSSTYGTHIHSFIAKMADGSYYYVGSGYGASRGLHNLISDYQVYANNQQYLVLPMVGMEGVKQIVNGYFLMEDGSVRAYDQCPESNGHYSNQMLGNNNDQDKSLIYHTPVTVWFGAEDDDLPLHVTEIVANTSTGSTNLLTMGYAFGLPTDFVLSITVDKYVHSSNVNRLILDDINGNTIPLDISINGTTLTLKAKNPADIQAGMIYILKIFGGSLRDLYGNGVEYCELRFTTQGTMSFDVPVTGIRDSATVPVLKYNETYSLTPTVLPENATVKNLVWSSDNPAVASVFDGVITAGKNGTATITATTLDGQMTLTYTVTVATPVKSFSLSSKFILLNETGKTCLLTFSIEPEILAGDATLFNWSSANTSVATVENGVVTAVGPGITAIYCTNTATNKTETCIVSVLADSTIATIDKVFADNVSHGVAMMADNNLWVVNDQYRYPKLVTNVTNALEENETIEKILSISDDDDTFLILTSANKLKYLVVSTGTVGDVFVGTDKNAPESIVDVVVQGSYVSVLTQNSTLWCTYWGSNWHYQEERLHPTFEQYRGLDGIIQIAKAPSSYNPYNPNQTNIYLLTANGTVCYMDRAGGIDAPCYVASWVFDVNIKELGVADGFLMVDQSGSYYPMTDDGNLRYDFESLCNSQEINAIKDQIVDIAVHQNYYHDSPMFICLLKDGSLVAYGSNPEMSPLYSTYSGYTWTQTSTNSLLYSITGLEATVVDIGHNYVLFSDGSVRLFARDAYLGDFMYSGYHSLVTPYFTQTTQDLTNLSLTDILVGESSTAEKNTETNRWEVTGSSSNRIELVFTLPLVNNTNLALTSILYKDANGQNVPLKYSVQVLHHSVVITLAEPLQEGITYTVTIRSNSISDIFAHNLGSEIIFTITVPEAEETPEYEAFANLYDSSLYPSVEYSPDYSLKELQTAAASFYSQALNNYIVEINQSVNNAILNGFANPDTDSWMKIQTTYDSEGTALVSMIGNYWGTDKADMIDRLIYDMQDSFDYAELLYKPYLTTPSETAYPFVTSIVVKNSEGNIVSSVGLEEITIYVYFNRDMDMTVQPSVTFAGSYPYNDHAVDGDWVDARTWVGTTRITAVTGSGTQFFKVRGAVADSDKWLVTGNDYERFAFTISTSGAKSMSLQANGGDGFIELEWTQDDFDTLAGYNVYRSSASNPDYFVKINSSIIDATNDGRNTYVDRSVEPGVEYNYRFTVVKTDFTESEPSGSATASSFDTTPPSIDHSAVGEAAEGSGVPVTAYVTDNMSMIAYVKIFYRIKGETEYSSLEMYAHSGANVQNKYSANIPANVVTDKGVEYYIEANDGMWSSYVGSASNPYTISTYKLYTITVPSLEGGKLSTAVIRARAGEWVSVSATPQDGYALLLGSIKYTDGETEVRIDDGFFYMPACDVTITATFLEKSLHEMGDLNMDGKVDSGDAILLLRYNAGLETLTNEQKLLADVNSNGRIDASDASEILRMDAGL